MDKVQNLSNRNTLRNCLSSVTE